VYVLRDLPIATTLGYTSFFNSTGPFYGHAVWIFHPFTSKPNVDIPYLMKYGSWKSQVCFGALNKFQD
jgi:hypothetical protein